jgi:hypothetical protein
MITNSREAAKFKRLFVGPIMPRRIRKERREEITVAVTRDPYERLDRLDERRLWDGAAMRRIATPNWANKDSIKFLYDECRRLTAETGIKHEVDHIIPVRHPRVCGLHTENNLRVMPAYQNNLKSNRYKTDWD